MEELELSVCADCSYAVEGIYETLLEDSPSLAAIREIWRAGYLLASAHGYNDDGTSYGYEMFSTSQCELCGDRFAGARFTVEGWMR